MRNFLNNIKDQDGDVKIVAIIALALIALVLIICLCVEAVQSSPQNTKQQCIKKANPDFVHLCVNKAPDVQVAP